MTNADLGRKVREHLQSLGIETPLSQGISTTASRDIEVHFQLIMEALGLDVYDDSLENTPRRIAKMFTKEIFYGLDPANFPKITTIENKMRYDEVIANVSSVRSMCEHHFVPFIGHALIGYIPKTKVLGLSKFNRVVDYFSRRPQVQERLTAQIQKTLQLILETEDVAVVVKARHYCVHLRGVKDEHSETVTSAMGGRFMSKPSLREEFLLLVGRQRE